MITAELYGRNIVGVAALLMAHFRVAQQSNFSAWIVRYTQGQSMAFGVVADLQW